MNFLSMQIMLGGAVLSALAHGPIFVTIVWALVSPTFNLAWIDWALAVTGYGVASYCAVATAWALRDWRIAAAALTMPLYWPLSTLAAALALLGFVFRPHYWNKTRHGLSARAEAPGAVRADAPSGEVQWT
jgi:TRAP-type C4-dicarboxylate transport system permease small subunit